MKSDGGQALGFGVETAGDGVGRGDVTSKGVRIAEEVCESDRGEGVVVGVVGAVEFDHRFFV